MSEDELIETIKKYMKEKNISDLRINLFDDPISDFDVHIDKHYSIVNKGDKSNE